MNKQKVVGKVGKFNIGFRTEQLTSHAGTVLLQDFARRLGVERVVDEELRVKKRERGYSEGQAIGGLVYNLILGGAHLSDLEVLRGDPGTQELLDPRRFLPQRRRASFCASLPWATCSDLPRVQLRLQQRVCPPQRATTCTLDLDSSISKQASGKRRARPKPTPGRLATPAVAFGAEEGELLFSHLRRGSAPTARTAGGSARDAQARARGGSPNCGRQRLLPQGGGGVV